MSIISEEIIDIINNPKSLKSIASVSKDGIPHVTYKGSLHVENGQLVFYDLIQSSQTNKNLVNTIWYESKVAVSVLLIEGDTRKNYLIEGRPVKCITAGKTFESVYISLQAKMGKDTDLSAIWYIEPESVRDELYLSRKQAEEEKYPYIKHLDRITENIGNLLTY